jgi:hypothetical protein
MSQTSQIREMLGAVWIPSIYAEKVRGQRTRSFALEITEKEHQAEILYTLLGIELKIGNKRIACPDLSTARYLRIFARVGCRSFAVPYDITMIAPVADEMETAWQRMLLAISNQSGQLGRSIGRLRSSLIREIRNELAEIGAGPVMPAFKASTRQRS